MKKISLLLAVLFIMAGFTGCGKEALPETTATVPVTTTAPTTEPATVATTVPPTEPIVPVVMDYQLDLPQGFEPDIIQENLQVYSGPNAPRDLSSIVIEVRPKNESVLSMEYERMSDWILDPENAVSIPTDPTDPSAESQETEAETEEKIVLDIREIETLTMDGWDAVMTEYVRPVSGCFSHVYRYEAVTTEANYVFSFSDCTDDNDWLEEFVASADSVDFILDTEGMELDYSALTRYDMRCGLSIYAEGGMEPHDAPGFSGALANKNVLFLVMADSKEDNNLTNLTLKDYANLVADTNKLDKFGSDMYGNLFTTFYSSDDNGLEYYNMICVKETSESFWVCQMTCLENDQVDYAKEFPLWASSIT